MAVGFNALLDWKIDKLLEPQRVTFESELNLLRDKAEGMLLAAAVSNYIEERLSRDNQRYHRQILAYKSLIRDGSFASVLKKTELSKLLWPLLDGERRIYAGYAIVDPKLIEKELSEVEVELEEKEMRLVRDMVAALVFSTRHMLALQEAATKAKELVFANAKIDKDKLRSLYEGHIFPAYKAGMDKYQFSGTRGGNVQLAHGNGTDVVNSLTPDASVEFSFFMPGTRWLLYE